MIELPLDKYDLVIEPLKKVTINNLFARSVVEEHVSGKILVDCILNPRTFYIIHPYGMSLLFGDFNNQEFNRHFFDYALNKNDLRTKFEWLQTFPREWDKTISELFGDKLIAQVENTNRLERGIIELNTRVNFKFNKDKYKQNYRDSESEDDSIVQTRFEHFSEMTGNVIPQHFWDNANDFMENGMGYTLITFGAIAATAYSAFVHDDKLEIGIETVEQYRGKGYAEKTCVKLIDYCLENRLEPVWSCRLENQASFKLAQKLGFEPTLMIPFYRLSN